MTLLTILRSSGGGTPANIQLQGTPTLAEGDSLSLSIDVPYPTGVTAGEVLIANITNSQNTIPTTPPAGWSLAIDLQNSIGNTVSGAIFYRIATGSETGSVTFQGHDTLDGRMTGRMTRWSGVNTSNPIDTPGGSTGSANSTSFVTPSLTTVTAGAVLIGQAHQNSATAVITQPAGMTKIGNNVSGSTGRAQTIAYQTISVAGATGTKSWSSNTSTQWGGLVIALRPATGPVGPSANFIGSGILTAAGVQTGVPPTLGHRIVGQPTTTSTVVSVKVTNATSVRLKVSTDAAGTTGVIYGSPVTPTALGNAKLPVSGLTPGTNYYYRVAMTGSGGEILDTNSVVGRLRTSPSGQANFSFNFGSCNTQTDPIALGVVADRGDDLFFHLGDFYYADGSGTGIDNFRTKFNSKVTSTNHQKVFATTPSNYTPSDHDGMNNNGADGNDPTAWANWRTVYDEYFPAPSTYYSFMYGRVLFIQIDDRNYKSATALTDNSSKTALGATQKQWLKDQITNTTAVAIVIAQSAPWITGTDAGSDGWGGFTTERTELANFFAASGKPIIMLAGDMHALAADDGTNAPGGITLFHAAPFYTSSSHKGGPYTVSPYPSTVGINAQHYGHVDVTDTGTQISFVYNGYTTDNVSRVSLTKTFNVNAPGATPFTGSGTLTATGTALSGGLSGVTYKSAGTVFHQAVAGTSWSIPYPATVAANDLLVLFASTGGGAMTTPAGWTEVYRETVVSNPKGGLFIKKAVGDEGGTTLSATTSSTTGSAIIHSYANVDTTTPQDVIATNVSLNATTDTTIDLPAVTTVTSGAMLIYVGSANSGSTTMSSTTGTERVDFGTTGATGAKSGAYYDESLTSAGSTGDRIITLSGGRAYWGAMLALRPAVTVNSNFTGSASFTGSGTLTAAQTPPQYVKDNASVTETAATTITTTLSPASVQGNLLVASIAMRTGQSVSLLSVADNGGNTWSFAGADYQGTSSSRIEVWYCLNANSVTSVTATFESAIKAGLNISEFSGLSAVGNAITGEDIDARVEVPVSISGPGLVFAALNSTTGTSADRTIDVTSGFTELTPFHTTTGSNANGDAAYRIVNTSGTYTAAWDDIAARNTGYVGVAFRTSGLTNKPLGSTTALRTTTIPGPVPLTYWSNDVLGEANLAVQRVVFVIHGTGGNAQGYSESILTAAVNKSLTASTLVVAPHFMEAADSPTGMYWPNEWREGANSSDASALSSFAVLDSLINSVDLSTYPNLKEIIVAGHSAGSQFVTRWAAGSSVTTVGRIVAANAGSYMYFDNIRPYSTTGATGYNDYKYGTDNRTSISYMAAPTEQQLKDRFAAKKMFILLGENDTVRDADLDTSAIADTQGLHRFERGIEFAGAHLRRVFGPSIYNNHIVRTVPSVGHSSTGMFTSTVGASALFDAQDGVSLTGTGTLTAVAGSTAYSASVSLTGTGTLTVQTSATVPVNVSLTGAGTLTIVPVTVGRTGSASTSGSGTLTVASSVATSLTVNLSGSGTLTTTVGAVSRTGSASLTGSGTLTLAVSSLSVITIANLSGSGTLGTQTGITGTGSAALSGSGTLTTSVGTVNRTGSGTFTGTGQLTAAATSITTSRTVNLTGSGTLSSAALVAASRTVALSGSGTLGSTVSLGIPQATTLSGSGTLTLSAFGIAIIGTAGLSGSGTLSPVATGMSHSRDVNLTGTGTLAPATSTSGAASANLSGSGALSTSVGNVHRVDSASFTGSGTLTSSAVISASRSTSFTGSGTLTNTSSSLVTTTCNLTGSGSLTTSTNSASSGNAVFSGSGSLSAAIATSISQVATLIGLGTLTAVASAVTQSTTANFSGSGTLNTQTAGSGTGTASLSGSSTLTVSTQTQILRSAGFTGFGTLSSAAIITLVSSVDLSGTGTLSVSGQQIIARTITLTGSGTLSTTGTARAIRTINTTGSGSLTSSSTSNISRIVNLTGSGNLSAVATVIHQSTIANFTGSGTIGFQTGTAGSATAGFEGTGTLAAVGISRITESVAFTGTSGLSVEHSLAVRVTSTFTGSSTLESEVTPALNRITILTGSGTLNTSRNISIDIERNLTGTGTLTVNTVVNPRIVPGTLELLTITMNSRQYNGSIIPNRYAASIGKKSYSATFSRRNT